MKRAVESVLNQIYPHIELLVVDDNGLGTPHQQETQALLAEYIDAGRLIYLPHDVNRNGSAARNTGFSRSAGDYIMFLDDDDEFTPERIEKQLAILEPLDESWGLSYCSYDKVQHDGRFYAHIPASKNGKFLYNVLMHQPSPATDAMMIRRAAYEKVRGFDESFRRHQDWEFVARLAAEYNIAAMKEVGLIVHMEFRNSAKNPQQVKEFREKYLAKVEPQIQMLSRTRQKRVLAENRYDVVMQYLKAEGLKGFWREYRKVGMGYFGLEFLVRRFYYIFRQKLQSRMGGR